jgi:hypothetical protein
MHPQENSDYDNGERHDHEPGTDAERSWNGHFAVIAELEKIALDERIYLRIKTSAEQNTKNASKQTI